MSDSWCEEGTSFVTKSATKHNEVDLPKVKKMTVFVIFDPFRTKLVFRGGWFSKNCQKWQKVQKNIGKTCFLLVLKPKQRAKSTFFLRILGNTTKETRYLEKVAFWNPIRLVLAGSEESVFGEAVLVFSKRDRYFLGFLKFWKVEKNRPKKIWGLDKGRFEKREVTFWKRITPAESRRPAHVILFSN